MIKISLIPKGDGINTIARLGDTVLATGAGAVCCQAARALARQGYDPAERLEFYRGDTLSLAGPLRAFARLTVRETTQDGVPRFVTYQPHPQGGQSGGG